MPFFGQLQHLGELLRGKGAGLARGLDLDEPAFSGAHKIGVHRGLGILLIIKIQQ